MKKYLVNSDYPKCKKICEHFKLGFSCKQCAHYKYDFFFKDKGIYKGLKTKRGIDESI